jgi:putative membrane protein
MMWDGEWGGLWIVVASLAGVAFWVLIFVLIVTLVRGRPGEGSTRGRSHALGVLEDRYARGEIGRDEFLERRAVLRGEGEGGRTPPP